MVVCVWVRTTESMVREGLHCPRPRCLSLLCRAHRQWAVPLGITCIFLTNPFFAWVVFGYTESSALYTGFLSFMEYEARHLFRYFQVRRSAREWEEGMSMKGGGGAWKGLGVQLEVRVMDSSAPAPPHPPPHQPRQ